MMIFDTRKESYVRGYVKLSAYGRFNGDFPKNLLLFNGSYTFLNSHFDLERLGTKWRPQLYSKGQFTIRHRRK